MHPVEHLYLFSCLAPSFIFFTSPFAFRWNGVHLLLSSAASHSGWEDHFQSDQYHYLHHRQPAPLALIQILCSDRLSPRQTNDPF